jgi:hypothetical protein
VILYDAWSNLPNRHLQAQVANIAATLSEVETRLAELKVNTRPPAPEERTSAMNYFRECVCLATPFGYHVHYFTDLNFVFARTTPRGPVARTIRVRAPIGL